MPTMIVNEDGEPIGFDYPEYEYPEDYGDDMEFFDYEEDGEEEDARGDSQYPETDLIWEG